MQAGPMARPTLGDAHHFRRRGRDLTGADAREADDIGPVGANGTTAMHEEVGDVESLEGARPRPHPTTTRTR